MAGANTVTDIEKIKVILQSKKENSSFE